MRKIQSLAFRENKKAASFADLYACNKTILEGLVC